MAAQGESEEGRLEVEDGAVVPRRKSVGQILSDLSLKFTLFYYGFLSLIGYKTLIIFMVDFHCNIFGGQVWGGSTWPFWASIASTLTIILSTGLLSSRTVARWVSLSWRCYLGCILAGCSIGGFMALRREGPLPMPGRDNSDSLGIALALVFTNAFGCGLLMNGSFGVAAAIDPLLTVVTVIGQGFPGVVVGFVAMFAMRTPGCFNGMFIGGILLYLGGVPLFMLQAYTNRQVKATLAGENPRAQRPSILDDSQSAQRRLSLIGAEVAPLGYPDNAVEGESPWPEPPCEPVGALEKGQPEELKRTSLQIFRQIAWPQALTVCLVLTVTYTIFPGVMSKWMPPDRYMNHVAIFQWCEIVGRIAPYCSWLRIRRGWVVSLLTVLRVGYVGIFVAIQRVPDDWARHAGCQGFFAGSLGFTQGYLKAMSMMIAPEVEGALQSERETISSIMVFMNVFGTFIGALLAFTTQVGLPLVAMKGQCPPPYRPL